MLKIQDQLEAKADEILSLKCKLENGEDYRGSIEKVEVDGDTVEIETYQYASCGCCPGDTYYYSFPVSYLFDTEWIEDVKKQVQAKKEAEEKRKAEEAQKRKEEQEKRERIEFERLKQKFQSEL
jgi:hypothetical protein